MAQDFHPSIKAILQFVLNVLSVDLFNLFLDRKAPEEGIFSYPLLIRDPITRYVNGKVVVIGDAAHVMRPVRLYLESPVAARRAHFV